MARARDGGGVRVRDEGQRERHGGHALEETEPVGGDRSVLRRCFLQMRTGRQNAWRDDLVRIHPNS